MQAFFLLFFIIIWGNPEDLGRFQPETMASGGDSFARNPDMGVLATQIEGLLKGG